MGLKKVRKKRKLTKLDLAIKSVVVNALENNNCFQTRAAQELEINRNTLNRYMRLYGIRIDRTYHDSDITRVKREVRV